jgi:hypothetical protein
METYSLSESMGENYHGLVDYTRVDTRPDGTIGVHLEMGYQETRIQDRKIYDWSHTSSYLGN